MAKKEAVSFFEDFERAADTLMWFTPQVTLKFNVNFARKDKDGNRTFFHQEYKYDSKYRNKDKVISIKRNFSYFISIDVNKDIDNSIMISQKDMVMLKLKLKKIIKWFTTIYKYENDKIILSGEWNSIYMNIGQYKSIQFDPIVLNNETNTEFKEGIRITLNNGGYYFDIDIDTFFEFYYIIDTFNMYQAAITMINYLPAEFGKFKTVDEFGNKTYAGGGFFNK